MNPKVMEAWFTLMAEAMRGTEQAQTALKSVPMGDPEAWQKWMNQFMPNATSGTASAFEENLEDWYQMMGVVPRARYLDALEKIDILQRRLEKAQETIETLRADRKDSQTDEAKQALDTWSQMLNETLKTQTEWMRAWTENNEPGSAKQDGDSAETSPKPDVSTESDGK